MTTAANKAADRKLCLMFLVAAKLDCLVRRQWVFETSVSSEIDIESQKGSAEHQPMTARGANMSPLLLVILQDGSPRLKILTLSFVRIYCVCNNEAVKLSLDRFLISPPRDRGKSAFRIPWFVTLIL